MPAPSRISALLVCLAAVAIGPAARAQSVKAPPAGADRADEDVAYPPPSARWWLMAGGLATTGVFYGAAAGISYAYPDAPGARDLRVPVVGPWLAIAHNGCPATEPDCSGLWVALRTVITAIDGAAQAGGLGIFLEGVFLPTAQPAPDAWSKAKKPENRVSLSAMPTTLGMRGIGIGVGGSF